ncbi:hypothetical protein GGR53DRAFT_41817 [Hypoxylon sp. FL1150]|nr:hypothetical protein GGR53DRAFT_41817 [Hypoxylon sp. FL1150]
MKARLSKVRHTWPPVDFKLTQNYHQGKRLWLRPGKRYLFGRTVAEPGQLAIKGEGVERVSRKHVTIEVDQVPEGDGEVVKNRSRVTIEDLGSKAGTWVNDEKIKGERRVLSRDVNVLQMGSFPFKFRITWFPVVLSFSFSANELRADPLSKLRQDLEQLDIKFLATYDFQATTHVVSKRRNVPKGLQALVNGRYIVTEGFYSNIIMAATAENNQDSTSKSALESDFDANWPDAMQFVPPPGDEAMPRPVEAFAPNPDRAEIFHGYTFIFYNRVQFGLLLDPITNGRGKAVLKEVAEGETQVDDFIRYVKEIAGEKGLGEFEDGSEGKGVVVVRYLPAPPSDATWFTDFYTSVSLRLGHRLVDQKEFLDAIISNDASILRRPLEAEPRTSEDGPESSAGQQAMDVDEDESPVKPQRPQPRRRGRGAVKSSFKGFGVDLKEDDPPESTPAASAPSPLAVPVESSQEGLFVSQDVASQEPPSEEPVRATRQSQRKRPPPPEHQDVLDNFAPTAAQLKRRRIAAGEDLCPPEPAPEVDRKAKSQMPKGKSPKVKKEIDVLDLARQHREEAEALAKAEREELATAPDDLDLAEIRRLQIQEPMEVRQAPTVRTREQDIADGRWDPSWNGRRNFKKFRQRGAPEGRPPQKIIVALEEVKSKGFGIGDDYWVENESHQKKKRKQTQSQSQSANEREGRRSTERQAKGAPKSKSRLPEGLSSLESSEDEDLDMAEEEEEDIVAPPSRTRTSRTSQQTSQSQPTRTTRTSQSITQKTQPPRTGKRPAPPPAKEQPAKRTRIGVVAASDDDDESDDEPRFRFGKR